MKPGGIRAFLFRISPSVSASWTLAVQSAQTVLRTGLSAQLPSISFPPRHRRDSLSWHRVISLTSAIGALPFFRHSRGSLFPRPGGHSRLKPRSQHLHTGNEDFPFGGKYDCLLLPLPSHTVMSRLGRRSPEPPVFSTPTDVF